ncbi:MAG TPA: hypothetical protein VMF89_07305 [Polyangiales bacterium]|nr:hypothetical protein [Polyangiales bacterium]
MTDNHGGNHTPMWDDPQESSALRQLLRAGRVEHSDYDVEQGLARHLAQLQAGAQVPAWAAQTTLQKTASWSLLAWLVPPVISAGVVGAWLALQPPAPVPASLTQLVPAPAKVPAPLIVPALVEPALAVEPSSARTSEAKEVKRVLEEREAAREQIELHDHANAVARNVRPATRSNSARRVRSSRVDDAPAASGAYSAVAQSRDSGGSGTNVTNVTSVTSVTSAKSANDEAVANKVNAPVSPAAQEPEPTPAPVEEAKAKSAERRAKQDDSATAKEDEVSGARLEREMRMLAVAQRVLTEDPARSLRLCRQGENEFRGSMFSAERKQVALLALVQLGKVEQARREGIPFLRAYPNAPWSARLREALSTGKLPNP